MAGIANVCTRLAVIIEWQIQTDACLYSYGQPGPTPTRQKKRNSKTKGINQMQVSVQNGRGTKQPLERGYKLSNHGCQDCNTKMDIEMQPKGPRKAGVRNERLFKCFAPGLYFVFGETSNPQAPFDNALHGLKLIFCTGVNETEEALNDSCCSAIALEVDK